ncbi:hypothetical protein PI125_g23500 [Phytophthora idaei]|nr:hypothetical protein PI125_g23500 [Phytophthora idaei]KAG3128679.1 hypothetical protein PI126_g21297 [Phytophthora idaei]
MPHVGVSRGAKAHAKSAATKQQTKSSKPRGKGSALQEATEVASKAVTSSGDDGCELTPQSIAFVAEGRWPEPALRRAGAQSWHRGGSQGQTRWQPLRGGCRRAYSAA